METSKLKKSARRYLRRGLNLDKKFYKLVFTRDVFDRFTEETVKKGLCPDCGRELSATSMDAFCEHCGWSE